MQQNRYTVVSSCEYISCNHIINHDDEICNKYYFVILILLSNKRKNFELIMFTKRGKFIDTNKTSSNVFQLNDS